MADILEVNLHIDGQVFCVKKSVLCKQSDYFRAMFSGNFVEEEQQDINIDMIDADSMSILLRYMNIGLIYLSEYSLATIGNLAIAANFLQITELIIQIEQYLDLQLSPENWIEIMTIAENSSYSKSAAFGLYSLKNMKPEYIPTLQRLFWYLSHPSLDVNSEFNAFNFGYIWIMHTETDADAFLTILGCLDMSKLTSQDLKDIAILLEDYSSSSASRYPYLGELGVPPLENYVASLADKVVECLRKILSNDWKISISTLVDNKEFLCNTFTDRVYTEVYNIVKESKERLPMYTPVVPVWKLSDKENRFQRNAIRSSTHYLYTFSEERGFEEWLEVAEKNVWGRNVASWGPSKLVVVGGENGRGTGLFMKDVNIYDSLGKEWTRHEVELPPRCNGAVVTDGDSLYLIGGIGDNRETEQTAIIYDLKQRTYEEIGNPPYTGTKSPAICSHKGEVYVSGYIKIYKYDTLHESFAKWVGVVETRQYETVVCMESYKGYIYCSYRHCDTIYRYKPDASDGEGIRCATSLSEYDSTAAFCNLGRRLIAFTNQMSVVTHKETSRDVGRFKTIWTDTDSNIVINSIAHGCGVIMNLPTVHTPISKYHQNYISQYANITYVHSKEIPSNLMLKLAWIFHSRL